MKMKLLEVLSVVLISAMAVVQGVNMSNSTAEPDDHKAAVLATAAVTKDEAAKIGCVAINEITCAKSYQERFEKLFKSRAHAIDKSPGFVGMRVLQDNKKPLTYLVMSLWESEDAFHRWTRSDEFREGHKRAFKDMAEASGDGQMPPMTSEFRTYKVIAD